VIILALKIASEFSKIRHNRGGLAQLGGNFFARGPQKKLLTKKKTGQCSKIFKY
jgi:hypothetical protein